MDEVELRGFRGGQREQERLGGLVEVAGRNEEGGC